PLDEELPDAGLFGPCHLAHHHDHHSAGGLAPLYRREFAHRDLYHHHRPVSGHCRAPAGRHGLCGQSRQGRHHRGLGGCHFERSGAGPRGNAGGVPGAGHPALPCVLRL
ncbi:PrgI family protein, partial [Dysosmobacter welbionis]